MSAEDELAGSFEPRGRGEVVNVTAVPSAPPAPVSAEQTATAESAQAAPPQTPAPSAPVVAPRGAYSGPSAAATGSALLQMPQKGFTKAERTWIRQLIDAINTVHAIKGHNTSISDSAQGQVINAEDCPACPPCP